jgi:pimeloyl-ACP methyl ester carboxylesterase
MSSVQSFSVERQGCRLAYDVRGNGPPVMLVQGVGVHGGGWRPQVEVLTERYQCLTFDHRGLNRSQPLAVRRLSVEDMAEDALAIMDAQAWESAHLIGHSLGGLVALHLALTKRNRVRSLALLCSFACGRQASGLSPGMLWTGLRTRLGTRRQRRHAFLSLVMPRKVLAHRDRDVLAGQLAPLFGHDLADQPPVILKQLRAMARYDASQRLGELASMPTVVVSAFHDRIARPALGRQLANAIPGSRYVEVPNAAHGLPLQLPELLNPILLEHLDQAEKIG